MKIVTSIKADTWTTGGISNPVPITLLSSNWTNWIPTYEPQRWIYDTNECSQLGGFITPLEIYINWLYKTGQLTPACLAFLKKYPYFDSNDNPSFSERFTGIMDGTSVNGNVMQNGWYCGQKYGILPRAMLNWSDLQASIYLDQNLMDTSYYDRSAVTQDMIDLASEFKKYFNISWGWASDGSVSMTNDQIITALQTSPVAFAGPIPSPVSLWNEPQVPYTGSTDLAHCFCGYNSAIKAPYPTNIADQYQPWLKELQEGYYLPVGIIFHVEMLQ